MGVLKDMVKERNLPAFLDQEKMKELLLENEYGILPDVEYSVTVSEPKLVEYRYCSGMVDHSTVDFTFTSKYGSHTFMVNQALYKEGEKRPLFLNFNFSSNAPDKYLPLEEILDNGFNVISVGFKDITSDDGDFKNGLCKVFMPNGQENDTTCGKIRLWAEAAMRIIDYAEGLSTVDLNNIAVVGHSRLGKTALVTGMLDKRIKYAISNNSGCSGAALCRGNMGVLGLIGESISGETIRDITKNFPYWFCKKYQQYRETNIPDTFDQHYLLASIAPRYVYVASASMDDWADPNSEFLCCVAASEKYEEMGLDGFVHNDRLPENGENYHKGRIGYHRRYGKHFISRSDWKCFMEYINAHKND